MINLVVFYILFFLLFFFLLFASIYLISLIYSTLKGAAFVPTKNAMIERILSQADLKKNQIFLDLGCGDGRLVRQAVKQYRVKGIGIDINPLLIFWAKVLTFFEKIPNIKFEIKDVFEVNLSEADVIYIFLMPKMISRLEEKLKKQTKSNVLIISHGFKIKGFENHLFKTLDFSPFPTYYYRLDKKSN